MFKRLITMCVVLMAVAPVVAQTVIPHVTDSVTGWRGGNNHSPNYCWMDAWPNTGSWGGYQDATLAVFDRAALQSAINLTIDTYGGWDAKILVTQPDWISTQDPKVTLPGLGPVVGSAQVETAPLSWAGANSFTAGIGSWAVGATTYSTFGEAVLTGVASDKSIVYDTINWTTELRSPWWDVVMDSPEYMLVHYMRNTAATGLFASAKTPYGSPLQIYQNQNPGSDIRVRVEAPPAGVSWINAVTGGDTHALWANRTIVQGAAPLSVPVQVNNAGTGTLAWTAAESPDVSWLSLTSASGSNGATFQMVLNVSGVTPGTYKTQVVITDNSSGNKTVTIPVTLTVQSATAVLQLVPATLSFQGTPAGANPAPQVVTVNNIGSGTLAWTAAEVPDASWMSINPTTGGNGGTFTVTINKTGLAAGTYTGSIRVTDPVASSSPQTIPVTLDLRDQDADIAVANGYDNPWQSGPTGWVATMRTIRNSRPAGLTATSGFVVLLGDSITYANPFGAWPRYGSGKTPDDSATCNWMHAGNGTSQTTNDGWYLARFDVPGRGGSYTAKSGITAAQYLAGTYGLPSMDKMYTAGFTNPDGKQYRDAQIGVIMLGTNDLGGYTDVQVAANLSTMVDKLQANGIIPVLTTIPPRAGQDAKVLTFVTAIRNLAESRKLPLIDYYQEIMRRRPGTTWQNTLISGDGVHPTGDRAGFTVASDPYASSGQALSEVGYLLRSWLTVQKIKEVKDAVLDPPLSPPAVPSNPSPANTQVAVPAAAALNWTGSAGATYNVYFGTTANPTLISSNQTMTTYAPTMADGTRYYWKVVAVNPDGQAAGPVWSFATTIVGDIDEDGVVGVEDLQILVASWNSTPTDFNWIPQADLNGDNRVNIGDLQLLVMHWGESAF